MTDEEQRWPSRRKSYELFEREVGTWDGLRKEIDALALRYDSRSLFWRGARRAEWPLFSSLYLALKVELGRSPSEDELVHAEKVILGMARHDWRFDQLSAMEIFARVQHVGGPTRLIDVTANPLIAAWFAVEDHGSDNPSDARLFAFASGNRAIHLNEQWASRHPWWHAIHTNRSRVERRWGTGEDVRVWVPPIYDSRIAAQSAAFIVDGSPVSLDPNNARDHNSGSSLTWTLEEVRETSSINLRLSRIERPEMRPSATPVFTFRILAEAKEEIRDQLERRFGYRASALYPDMSGLSQVLNHHPKKLLAD